MKAGDWGVVDAFIAGFLGRKRGLEMFAVPNLYGTQTSRDEST
jgi:hypothetical protein